MVNGRKKFGGAKYLSRLGGFLSTFPAFPQWITVLVLDGNSAIGAHVCDEIDNLICLRPVS